MKRSAVALAFALYLVPALAHAEGPPSRWERAKDPDKIEDYRLHRSAQRMFPLIHDTHALRSDLYERLARDLVTSLDAWDAANSSDVRLRLDLGRALFEKKEYRRALTVLRSAVEMAPDHPAMDDAWFILGLACGHLGDHVCERDAYQKTIDLETEDAGRMTPTLNLAEVEMHLGHLKESIALYQETSRLATRVGSNTTIILAEWGLAVANDREGDRAAAERSAKRALELSASIHHDMLHDANVSYFPPYEINYYEGLGAVVLARNAKSAHDASIHWGLAERSFERYVRGAEQTNPKDRFLSAAKTRHASCKAEREKAEKKRVKEPLKRTDEEELPL
jgi:tetratricopeptide (TPR) repeat protein